MVEELVFDNTGSSHIFRDNSTAQTKILPRHVPDNQSPFLDTTVTIFPCQDHLLDYYNNHFVKQEKQQLIEYMLVAFGPDVVKQKLLEGWNYIDSFDKNTPVWILREFFSFWIDDALTTSYNIDKYIHLPGITITTQDLFLNFTDSLAKICQYLKLELLVDQEVLLENHNIFLNNQYYHDSQLKCKQWINDIITNTNTPTPCQTIFDEAYVQHGLRMSGYNIQCNELNVFPKTASAMKDIIEPCHIVQS